MHKKIFISTVLTFIIISLFVSIPAVSAAGFGIDTSLHPPGAPTVTGKDTETAGDIEATPTSLTFKIVNVILSIAGVAAIFFILNNAWYLVISSGSEEKITEHKTGLMWSVIGLILIILSYSIIRFVISIPFGADETVLNEASQPSGQNAQTPGGSAPANPVDGPGS